MKLNGRNVLLVGVSTGLGAATAYYLLKEGANVVISGRTEPKLKNIVSMLSRHGKISYIKCDASTPKGAERALKDAAKIMGGVDDIAVLVGGYLDDHIRNPSALDEMTLNHIKIPLYVVNAALSHLHKGSSVVLVSSALALHKAHGPLSYSISKVGTAKEVELLAHQLMDKGIRVNGIAPLSIDGEFKLGTDFKSRRKLGDAKAPPDDFARVIAWLMSDEAEWVNGVVIPVDGGARLK
ncbi:MAG: SDR family oxidoreductase [Candidatus Micrarchaeota archaeon]|nr:SDR family oxidoreductase [Candidatus Micrarchaeota archaeon]